MRIAFFVSNHGFGHIMRNLPVAEELIMRGHKVIMVSGEKQLDIADQYLAGRAVLVPCDTDAGLIVKPGSLIIDHEASIARIKEHISKWSSFMKKAPNADKYIVDIVPWALMTAKEKGIPSYFMASFTWVDQYKPFLDENLLDKYREAFSYADKVLYYDLVNTPTRNFFGESDEIGFVARPFNMDKVDEIRSKHNKPIVFISLGASNTGFDFEIDVSKLPYDFISTKAVRLSGDNVEYLNVETPNTQDYIKASDYCISKAGWSTVAEAMLAGVPFAVFEREDTPEDMMTIDMLKERHAAILISVDDFKNLGRVLKKMETYEWSKTKYTNGYKKVADIICGER